mmetsp:Transcript_24179/g.75205  ORF Transcript_24179/g.75205 Transcript_24179/m.75205 type:complete len:278 (+) Transcript_24179:1070-1903(+)
MRGPVAPQLVRRISQPALGVQPVLAQPLRPGPNHVHLGPQRAEGRVDQPGQDVVVQQRLHVVAVAEARQLARRKLAAVGGVVEEALVAAARGHELLQVPARRRIDLVVRAMRQDEGHLLGYARASRVRVDQKGGPKPVANPPQAGHVSHAFRGSRDDVGLKLADPDLQLVQVRKNVERGRLRVRQLVVPLHLVAGVDQGGALPRVQLQAETGADDEDTHHAAVHDVARPASRAHPAKVPVEVREVEAPLAAGDRLEDAGDGVEDLLVVHRIGAVHVR